jgi:hypothetical protein
LKKRNLRKRKKTRQISKQSNALKEPNPDGVRLEEKGEDMPQLDYTQGMLKKRQAEQRPPQAPVGTPPAQAPPAAAAPAGTTQEPAPQKPMAPARTPQGPQGSTGQESVRAAGQMPPPPPPPASTTSTGTQMPIQPPANIPSMKDFQWQQPTQTPTPGMGPGGAPGLQKPGFMPGGEQTTPQTGPGMKGKGGGQQTTTTMEPPPPTGTIDPGNQGPIQAPPERRMYGTSPGGPPPPQEDPNQGGAGPGFDPYQEPAPQEQPQRFQGGLM